MDINNFGPLNADVWGTVSDWFIGVVTTIGTYYVVATFRQQKLINEEQKELNRIALEKDRRDIMPPFRYKETERITTEGIVIIKGGFYVVKNRAMNIVIYEVMNGKYEAAYSQTYILDSENATHRIKIEFSFLENSDTTLFSEQALLSYTDEVGRPYYQRAGVQNNKVVTIWPLQLDKPVSEIIPV